MFAHLAGLLSAVAAYLKARLHLMGLESKEAALHYGIILGLVLAALVVSVFGYLFLCFGIVFAVAALIGGEHTWIWVTFGMALLHLGSAGAALFIAKTRLGMPMFSTTLEEFRKDQEWLTTESRS